MRRGADDPARLEWPEAAAPHRAAFAAAFHACDLAGRAALRAVLAHYLGRDRARGGGDGDGGEGDGEGDGMAAADALLTQWMDGGGGGAGGHAERHAEDAFGGSVQRFLTYPCWSADAAASVPSGDASSAHADFGLLTVAPPSTLAALQLRHPATGEVCEPEHGLGPTEWLVFCGQAVSYLTGGELQAPLHRVPRVRVRGASGEVRCAAPHFVRPAPAAELEPFRGTAAPLTYREFVSGHTKPLRPWGNLSERGGCPGDW